MQPTKNQKAIYKLLTTSTWSALCDSGGAYGRHWERNQKKSIQDFIREPEIYTELTTYQYDTNQETEHLVQSNFHRTIYHYDKEKYPDRESNTEYSYTISLFHWLNKYFDIANEEQDPFVAKFNRLRKGTHAYMEDRQEEYLESINYQRGDTFNSCNQDSNLSQVYTLTPVFPIGEEYNIYEHQYHLLSIHQWCDVRWGYTIDIMVRIDMDDNYPREDVYWFATYTTDVQDQDNRLGYDNALGYSVSNTYDGYRIRFDEHPTLQDEEIDPELIATLSLFLW